MRISFSRHSQIHVEEVKCHPVDKLCKTDSGGKADKGINALSGVLYPFTLQHQHSLYPLYLYTVCTPRQARMPVGGMQRSETHLGVTNPLPLLGANKLLQSVFPSALHDDS